MQATASRGPRICLVAASVLIGVNGCHGDPYSEEYVLSKPAEESIVGKYVFEACHGPHIEGVERAELILRSDQTYTATAIPAFPHGFVRRPAPLLPTASGKWRLCTTGTLYGLIGKSEVWGVDLGPDADQPSLWSPDSGERGLLFELNDPDSGEVLILRRVGAGD